METDEQISLLEKEIELLERQVGQLYRLLGTVKELNQTRFETIKQLQAKITELMASQ